MKGDNPQAPGSKRTWLNRAVAQGVVSGAVRSALDSVKDHWEEIANELFNWFTS